MIYSLFSRDLHALRNVVIRNKVPYEQGIHVFVQPVIGPTGILSAYSLAVTGTTSLAFSNGVPDNGDTRELFRSTRLLYVPIHQLNPTPLVKFNYADDADDFPLQFCDLVSRNS